ncbi:MAG: ribosome silencing factor [Comamonadaceae bacterium]|nr:ribosome silencing factor [Comamonadaceae bacterium]
MTETSTSGKKDIQKLQRAIVDGLEDVKAQDIKVFDTEHLSPLFERVIVASGTSNRQTKALAASVRDKVREAGFPKPRIEGEENGEWIIVDCGAAVAHVMQPTIRTYYNLEEIWGDKPVRLKFGAARPLVKAEVPAPKKAATRTARTGAPASEEVAGKTPAKAPAKPAARRPASVASPTRRQSVETVKSGEKAANPIAKRPSVATKTAVTKVVVPAAAKRASAKKVPAKNVAAKRAPARKPASGKA